MLWLDGRRLDGPVAKFDLRDRGLLLGDGVFDTSMALNGAVALVDRHVGRLSASCDALGIPFDPGVATAVLSEAAAVIGTGALRLTVTRGPAERGLVPPANPTPRMIVAAHAGAPATTWRPVRLAGTEIRRNETSPTSRHKALGYLDAIMALRELSGRADEILFLNTTGRVACCATGNLFVLRSDVLLTPPLADGVLPGVVREVLLELAFSVGLKSVQASLSQADLLAADAAFMTNSLRLVSPVSAVDGVPLAGVGNAGVTRLARALVAKLEQMHGPCPHLAAGLQSWPEPD